MNQKEQEEFLKKLVIKQTKITSRLINKLVEDKVLRVKKKDDSA